MFEIQHVEHEQPFYQIENLPVYKMRCTLFEYTGEDFDTSIEGIQDIEKTGSYQYKVCVTGTADAEATAELGFTTYDSPIGSVGGVKLITLDRGGAYYTTAPSVRFVGGGDSSFTLGDSAAATAVFDAASGTVTGITLTDSGTNYATLPTIQFIGGNLGVDSDYRVGDTVAQQLSSTATISGEIQRIVLDSAGDSDMCLFLAHVGTDDGQYHTFAAGGELINTTRSGIIGRGLTIVGVTEDNKISETEQNDIFENLSDDFLDFSEDNPFGDPQ